MKKYSVSQLNNFIKNVFEDEFVLSNVSAVGEVAEYKFVGNNAYFTLKDQDAAISCIHFGKPAIDTVDQILGQRVVVEGRVTYYAKVGKISFVCRAISLEGEGEQYAKFLRLKAQLGSQGCFDRVVPLPSSIKSIGLITSAEGAVVYDFLKVARQLDDTVDIFIYSVRVQGENSAIGIVQAIDDINKYTKVDCIVLARGGGSQIDLDVFNSESLVRAVANSKIAVVSAIGHEVDYTLCDLAASLRAGTPSIAAQLVIKPKSQRRDSIACCLDILRDNLVDKFDRVRQKLASFVKDMLHSTILKIGFWQNCLKNDISLLCSNTVSRLDNFYNRCRLCLTVLDRTNPTKLLISGYAKVQKDSIVINTISQINGGDNISIYLSDGSINATVTKINSKSKNKN